MLEVDIVLFDMISTGLAEAFQIGVPALVYPNKHEYKYAPFEGKYINDELEEKGIVFDKSEKGIRSFDSIVNNVDEYKYSSKEVIRLFQDMIAHPVGKTEYLINIDKKLNS